MAATGGSFSLLPALPHPAQTSPNCLIPLGAFPMAPLIFRYGGGELSCELRKVERAHLYGSVRTEVLDAGGLKCRLATLAADGHTIIDSGGTALAYLTPENNWLDKAALKAVDLQGREISPVGSSFKATIDLSMKATVEEYLSH